MNRLLREPLIQFLLFGALLFGLHAMFGTADSSDARIVVPAQRAQLLEQELTLRLRRPPTGAERQAAMERWIDEELLMRQAQRLGLDRTDTIVRRRLGVKMESLIMLPAEAEAPSDAELQALLAADPQRYGTPERHSFEQIAYVRSRRGDHLLADAQAGLQRLRDDPESAAPLGDAFFAGRRLLDQSPSTLRSVFGRTFADTLATLPVGGWHGPIESGYGLHLVRIESRKPFEPATLEAARERLQIDWRETRKQALLRDYVAALRAEYEVVVEEPAGASNAASTRGVTQVDAHE
ncbi:MAG: peptidylprolyl isomerase [Pseudomonadota bacterium]|nr:peptidylprolyl isomerase [Pseudomonadota bacterium]